MALWIFSLVCITFGVKSFTQNWVLPRLTSAGETRRTLKSMSGLLHEIEESLLAGLLPNETRWRELKQLPEPWGTLTFESLQDLRIKGGALVPTVRRLRDFAELQLSSLAEARGKAMQAFAQAVSSCVLVPAFGIVLYKTLPGLEEVKWTWVFLCTLGLSISAIGAAWIWQLADRARWGGLRAANRDWIILTECFGERLMALVKSGLPPDLAWSKACQTLQAQAPSLVGCWGTSVWEPLEAESVILLERRSYDLKTSLIQFGVSTRKAIFLSLTEGRACTERLDSSLSSLRAELKASIERELSLLGLRALRPLFLFVAPPILGLLACALFFSWSHHSGF